MLAIVAVILWVAGLFGLALIGLLLYGVACYFWRPPPGISRQRAPHLALLVALERVQAKQRVAYLPDVVRAAELREPACVVVEAMRQLALVGAFELGPPLAAAVLPEGDRALCLPGRDGKLFAHAVWPARGGGAA